DGEIVHCVVEQDAGARYHETSTKPRIERDRHRDAVAFAIEDREMSRADAATRIADIARKRGAWRSAIEADRSTLARGVVGAQQALDRHRYESRVAEILRAIAMHAAQALDDHVLARDSIELREIVAIEDVERVDDRDSAG